MLVHQAPIKNDAADPNNPKSSTEAAIDPSRSLQESSVNLYLGSLAGPQSTPLGSEVSRIALTEMFRAVFRRTNLRRTPGPQGELKRVHGLGSDLYLTEDWSSVSPLPTSMRVCWDE